MSVAIFVPVYNDEKTLGNMLKMIPERVGSHKTEIFIVDDGSSDGSYEIARDFTKNVFRHECN